MTLEGARWERLMPGAWKLLHRDGSTALALVRRMPDGPHWLVTVLGVAARCDRPGIDAAMLMAAEALLR